MVRFRIGALVTTAAIAFAACSGANTPAPATAAPPSAGASASASAPAPSASATIKEGGKLVAGIPGDMVTADPALVSDSNSSYVMNNVVEGLLRVKPGTIGELEPALAEAMPEVSTDKLTYTFKLHSGVKFHDGTDLNADAVVYNYLRQKNTPKPLQDEYNYYFAAVFGGWGDKSNLKAVEKVDDLTVKFTLTHPQLNFLISQAPLPQFGIQSPAALKAGDADNPDPSKSPYAQGQGGTGKSMVGTGPFMFKEWVPNDHVTIIKNPSYWDAAHAAHLDEITFRPFADQTAELNALQAGDIDFAQTILPNDAETLKTDAGFTVYDRGDSCNLGHLAFNHKFKPFDNEHIRKAIAYALNKPSYISALYAGQAVPADNWMPPASQFYKPLGLPTYDPQKAKDEIAASGLSGDALTLEFHYPSDVSRPYMPDPKALAEAIATDLEAVGFKITFQTAGWRTGYIKNESAGNYPMWLIGWTCDWPGADNFLYTAFFHPNGDKVNTEFNYSPKDLVDAMNEGLSTGDEATEKSAWEKAQDILARDLPTIPLVSSRPPAASKADVKGFVGAGNLNELFNSVWLDR
jgi:peptide/nickel transport system substrate-binding protein